VIAAEQVERVRRWIENYHQIKEHLEKIPRSIANCCGGSACQREDSRTAAYNLVHDHPEFWAGLFHSFEIV